MTDDGLVCWILTKKLQLLMCLVNTANSDQLLTAREMGCFQGLVSSEMKFRYTISPRYF